MADLRAVVEDLGGKDVRTYLQSGNVVFRSTRASSRLAGAIEKGIRGATGLDVAVVIRTDRQLRRLVTRNPFAGQKELHVAFLASKPTAARVNRLRERSFGRDRFEVDGENVYLFYPGGYGRTNLSNAALERHLGSVSTTRNWRTVTALAELTAAC
jgi:uncharacterized protein (DUF1697 family)